MILVGNQRGGAKDLAIHLLKEENDHVQVHDLRGFVSDNLMSALNESYAISRATRCKQHLFSLSANPPPDQEVSTEAFEAAIKQVEERLGLSGQPRAIVFHEKQGRRHAHAVWSRIDSNEMKAVQLSHTKRKLTELSRELFIEHGFKMPRGLMKSEERDPRNFTLEEWQQAKRAEKDPKAIKTVFQDCWAVSDSRAAFANALETRGYKLARGDRRGFVAVDRQGEVYAVARWTGVKTKDVRMRLGEIDGTLPSVEQRKAEFVSETSQRLREIQEEEARNALKLREQQETARKALATTQAQERARQNAAIQARWKRETAMRQERFNRGWRGLMDHFSGRVKRIREENMAEAYRAVLRDRREKDALVFQHLSERRVVLERFKAARRRSVEQRRELASDVRRLSDVPESTLERSKAAASFKKVSIPDAPKASVSEDFKHSAAREEFKRKRRKQVQERTVERGPTRGFDPSR